MKRAVALALISCALLVGAKSCGAGFGGRVYRLGSYMAADYTYDGSHGRGNVVADLQRQPLTGGPWENEGEPDGVTSQHGEAVSGHTSVVQERGLWRLKVTFYNTDGDLASSWVSGVVKERLTWTDPNAGP